MPTIVPQEEYKKELAFLREKYDQQKPTYELTLSMLKRYIAELKVNSTGRDRFRIAYIDGRVKPFHSVLNKAFILNIPGNNLFYSIDDLIGIRIVVNNQKDIDPLIEEVKKLSGLNNLSVKHHEDESGYRATHVKCAFKVADKDIPVEIQIRTLFQDAWAILSHHDIYKNMAELPPLAKPLSENMSRVLGALDKMADDFRQEIEAKVVPPHDLSDDSPLNREGIAFLYYELFGENPQEYETQYLLKMATEYGVKKVGEARTGLKKKVFDKLRKIHKKRFPMLHGSNYDLFGFGLLFAAEGDKSYREYRKKVENDWAEIETIAKNEALSGMPESFDEFVEMIKNGNFPWEAIDELGGIDSCFCGSGIISPSSAAEAILNFYGNPDTAVDLQSLLVELIGDTYEIESLDFPGACQYCGYLMSKDD